MITIENFLKDKGCWTEQNLEGLKVYHDVKSEDIIEFAKLHVKEALKEASENVESFVIGGLTSEVNKESILNAYPLENIK